MENQNMLVLKKRQLTHIHDRRLTMNTLTTFSISAVLLAVCSGNVFASDDSYSQGISSQGAGSQENRSSDSRRGRRGPPPEAYTACENKADGDTAQFENPRGKTVIGTCEQEGEKMVLRPNNRKGGKGKGRRGPPPEAYTACESKSAGDTAQFESPRGKTVTGTCEQEGEKMVLRPDRHNRRSRGEGTRGGSSREE